MRLQGQNVNRETVYTGASPCAIIYCPFRAYYAPNGANIVAYYAPNGANIMVYYVLNGANIVVYYAPDLIV